MAAILGECNSESNRTKCNVSVVSILLVQQRGDFRIVRQFFCKSDRGRDKKRQNSLPRRETAFIEPMNALWPQICPMVWGWLY